MMAYHKIYRHMCAQLKWCKRKGMPPLQEIQHCFEICYTALTEAEQQVAGVRLGRTEEVFYLKQVRPAFLARLLYFQHLYHAWFFLPEDRVAAKRFWARELLRLERYTEENAAFYQYYKSGRSNEDYFYFKGLSEGYCFATSVESDMTTAGTGDFLIAQLMCLERYSRYVEKQLQVLRSELT